MYLRTHNECFEVKKIDYEPSDFKVHFLDACGSKYTVDLNGCLTGARRDIVQSSILELIDSDGIYSRQDVKSHVKEVIAATKKIGGVL